METLKEQLGIDNDRPIPADYNIPYFVHQENMNRMDMSHKRVESWHLGIIILLIVLLVGTNIFWLHYENQFYDEVTMTQETSSDGDGDAIINGAVIYGESNTNNN